MVVFAYTLLVVFSYLEGCLLISCVVCELVVVPLGVYVVLYYLVTFVWLLGFDYVDVMLWWFYC